MVKKKSKSRKPVETAAPPDNVPTNTAEPLPDAPEVPLTAESSATEAASGEQSMPAAAEVETDEGTVPMPVDVSTPEPSPHLESIQTIPDEAAEPPATEIIPAADVDPPMGEERESASQADSTEATELVTAAQSAEDMRHTTGEEEQSPTIDAGDTIDPEPTVEQKDASEEQQTTQPLQESASQPHLLTQESLQPTIEDETPAEDIEPLQESVTELAPGAEAELSIQSAPDSAGEALESAELMEGTASGERVESDPTDILEAPAALEVPEAPEVPEALEVPEAPEIPEASEAPEAPEVPGARPEEPAEVVEDAITVTAIEQDQAALAQEPETLQKAPEESVDVEPSDALNDEISSFGVPETTVDSESKLDALSVDATTKPTYDSAVPAEEEEAPVQEQDQLEDEATFAAQAQEATDDAQAAQAQENAQREELARLEQEALDHERQAKEALEQEILQKEAEAAKLLKEQRAREAQEETEAAEAVKQALEEMRAKKEEQQRESERLEQERLARERLEQEKLEQIAEARKLLASMEEERRAAEIREELEAAAAAERVQKEKDEIEAAAAAERARKEKEELQEEQLRRERAAEARIARKARAAAEVLEEAQREAAERHTEEGSREQAEIPFIARRSMIESARAPSPPSGVPDMHDRSPVSDRPFRSYRSFVPHAPKLRTHEAGPPKPYAVAQLIEDNRPPAPSPPMSKARPRYVHSMHLLYERIARVFLGATVNHDTGRLSQHA
jgi:hypothetical protein